MPSIFRSLLFSVLLGTSVSLRTTTKVCPLLGPAFPAPTGLSTNEKFQAATKLFDVALDTSLKTDISSNGPSGFNTTTFSIGMFSTSEEGLIYQRHYTDPSVRDSKVGVHEVNADSIYRLGSIGKLLTVYLFLIHEGDEHFNDPVTKYIPQLATAAASNHTSRNGVTPNWNEITIGQLASQMSGLARDYGIEDLSYPFLKPSGFPSIPKNQVPACNFFEANESYAPCNNDEYLAGVIQEPALFAPSYTPVYSNNGFQLLGIALENIANSTLEKLFNQSIVEALELLHTSWSVPKTTQNGVIPGNTTSSSWGIDDGALAPAGGQFSSTNDVATIGKAILNSTLLPQSQTRRWMKPVTFTSDPLVGVGAPWEIFRTEIGIGNRTIDLYTKQGGIGFYSALIILIPDFDMGFSILTASEGTELADSQVVYLIADMIAESILPALDEIAKIQAQENFAGHYAASYLNSSLTITVDDQPGLRVTNWISNDTDLLAIIGGSGSSADVDFRIQPNQLYTIGSNEVGFTGWWQVVPTSVFTGPFSVKCLGWSAVDAAVYGNVGVEDYVFKVHETGKATELRLRALRVELERERDV